MPYSIGSLRHGVLPLDFGVDVSGVTGSLE